MKYLKFYEGKSRPTNHDFYQIQIIQNDDNFQVEIYFKDSIIDVKCIENIGKNTFNSVKEYIIKKLEFSTPILPVLTQFKQYSQSSVSPNPIYVIKIRDWSRDKSEPAFDVEIYWKDKYIGGTDGVFSIKNKDKYSAFVAAKNYIKQKLITLPLNYDVIIKGNQFDL